MDFANFAAFGMLVCGSLLIILTTSAHVRGRVNRSYMLSSVLVGAMFLVISTATFFHVVWLQALCGLGTVAGSLGMIRYTPPHNPETMS
jgi:hypothetical protein